MILFNNKVLVNLVFYFISVKIFLHYSVPTVLRIISDYQFELEDHVKIIDLLAIYYIEIFSWFWWLIGFLLIGYLLKEKFNVIDKREIVKLNPGISKYLFLVISVGFVIHMYYQLTLKEEGLFFLIFSQLFFFAGLTVGPLLMFHFRKPFNLLFFLTGIIVFLVSIFSIATRGAMIYTLFYFLFLALYLFRTKKIIIQLLFISILSICLFFIFPSILGGKVSINENGLEIVSQDFVEKQQGRSFVNEIEWRLGAPTRIGTAFLALREQMPAGFNPIKHSLIGVLPRSINENKPHPSSLIANDPFSLGMYLICKKIYGTESLMVEFPTGAHFYWEFGVIGIIILSIVSGIYIALCLKFWSNLGVVAIPLVIATFKPFGYVDPKIWVSDIAMQIYQIILPTFFLIITYKLLNKIFKTFGLKRKKTI